MTLPLAVMPTARLAASPAAVLGDGHSAMYETCVAVIIAVLVVLYLDENVRGMMTLPQRGQAIGWLGGILTLGILIAVMTLAGFTPDTADIRVFTVITTALFLLAAFGIAISAWGREDGRRLREAATSPLPPVPPVPVPSPHLSERERAAEVLGYAFLTVAQANATFMVLTRPEPTTAAELARAREFLSYWAARWAEMGPSLAAIIVGYPSPQVREHVQAFLDAASRALSLTVKLAGFGNPPDHGEREQLTGEASGEFSAVAAAQKAVTAALHPEDGNAARAVTRAHRPRTSADGKQPVASASSLP